MTIQIKNSHRFNCGPTKTRFWKGDDVRTLNFSGSRRRVAYCGGWSGLVKQDPTGKRRQRATNQFCVSVCAGTAKGFGEGAPTEKAGRAGVAVESEGAAALVLLVLVLTQESFGTTTKLLVGCGHSSRKKRRHASSSIRDLITVAFCANLRRRPARLI